MSARVVADLGEQMVGTPGGGLVFAYVLLLSCGCRVEVDRRHIVLMHRPDEEWRAAIENLQATHECAPKGLPPPARSLSP